MVKPIGYSLSKVPSISPKLVYELCKNDTVIIDLRPDYISVYKQFGVSGVIGICEHGELDVNDFNENSTYILAETSQLVKGYAIYNWLNSMNIRNVYNLAGGFVEWERDGLPVIENMSQRLSGSCACQLRTGKRG